MTRSRTESPAHFWKIGADDVPPAWALALERRVAALELARQPEPSRLRRSDRALLDRLLPADRKSVV
jgi:hypothetical protein